MTESTVQFSMNIMAKMPDVLKSKCIGRPLIDGIRGLQTKVKSNVMEHHIE